MGNYRHLLWLAIWGLIAPLIAGETPVVTFDLLFPMIQEQTETAEPIPYEGQRVEVRGFIYYLASKQWILAPEPNLQSCCLGSKEKARKQLLVQGSLPPSLSSSAIVIQGILQRLPLGQHPSLSLVEATLVEENHSPLLYFASILISLGLFLGWKKRAFLGI